MRTPVAQLHRDDVDVHGRRGRERGDVGSIGRKDLVPIGREQHQRGVDHVMLVGAAEENAGTPPEILVEIGYLDGSKKSRHRRLPPVAATPNLPNNTAMGERHAPRKQLSFEERCGLAIGPLDGQECARIQEKPHPAPPRRRARGPSARARTVTARAFARRAARSISSGLIAPCSASYESMNAASA